MYSEKPAASVLIVSSTQKAIDYLTDILPHDRFSPVVCASGADEAKRVLSSQNFDIVMINTPLADEFGTTLATDIATESSASVMLFVKNEMFEQVSYTCEDCGIFTVAKPGNRQIIYQALSMMLAMRNKIRILEEKAQGLQSKMEEIRLVNRAKSLLIKSLGMSEADAHRYIEKTAMDACVRKRDVAQNIIKTYEY